MGRSYLPLAVAGLDALELWASVLPPGVIEPYYQQLLPCLDAYLRTEAEKGLPEYFKIINFLKQRLKKCM